MTRWIRLTLALIMAGGATLAPAAEPDHLVLPPGFHASVVADGLKGLRHFAFRGDGDLYVSTRGAAPGNGIIALHLDADHKAVTVARFGDVTSGTGIRVAGDWLYAASPTTIYRFRLAPGLLVPTTPPETMVSGLPAKGFLNRLIAFDGRGGMFVSAGGIGNICAPEPAMPGTPPVGRMPCPDLAERSGIRRFRADRPGQAFADGERIATGIRDMDAMDWQRGDALYGVTQGRNGLNDYWPTLVSPAQDEAVAEEMHRIVKGSDLGWPYSYYDQVRRKRLLAPEYGGDGQRSPDPGRFSEPVVAFPGHSAPLDLVFYDRSRFPAAYRGGAFVAFHGGLGPDRDAGYNGYVVGFVPFDRRGHPGPWTVFADGFAGPAASSRTVGRAAYRPTGLAVGPDGALYVGDSVKGRIWRIAYAGG